MNKRRLDLSTRISTVLTLLAATPDNKELLQVLPWDWQPYVIKIGLLATSILAILAHFAPPTPSPLPDDPNATNKLDK